ncbi:FliM/FliN family flagellar motor switch protein [Undibacterium sp. Di27W]|uniref:FliM/FliN family flagellar motor switch protein n=1 Tax=Undibacterium sp. Di27W TaxID=3413036 RepID=UPI003BF43923
MIKLPELEAHDQAPSNKALPVMASINPLHSVKTKLQVYVGEVELSIGELLSLKQHQIVPLGTDVDQTIDLILEGHTVARGNLVAVDGQFAIQISELPVSLKP